MKTAIRTANLDLSYSGADLPSLDPHVKSFRWTTHAHGASDQVRVVLEDRDHRWAAEWFPRQGAEVEAYLVVADWDAPGGLPLVVGCGAFSVDEITLRGSGGSGDEVEIAAVSTAASKSMRYQKKTRHWENVAFAAVAEELAEEHGLNLVWRVSHDLPMRRLKQEEQGDLSFLKDVAESRGCLVRVEDGELIVAERRLEELKLPSLTIARTGSNLLSYDFRTQAHDIYHSCLVRYWSADLKANLEHLYVPPNPPKLGEVLVLNATDPPVTTTAEAEAYAKAALNLKNRHSVSGSLTLLGTPGLTAGQMIALKGFTALDDRYFIAQCEHKLDSGGAYTTALSVEKRLTYED